MKPGSAFFTRSVLSSKSTCSFAALCLTDLRTRYFFARTLYQEVLDSWMAMRRQRMFKKKMSTGIDGW